MFEDLMNLVIAFQAGGIPSTEEMTERPIAEANAVIWNKGKSKEKYASLKDTISPPKYLVYTWSNCGCTKHGVPFVTMNIRRTYYVS